METDIKLSSSNTNFLVNKLLRKIFIIILNFYNIDLKLAYNKKEAYLHFEVSLLVFILCRGFHISKSIIKKEIETLIFTKDNFDFIKYSCDKIQNEINTSSKVSDDFVKIIEEINYLFYEDCLPGIKRDMGEYKKSISKNETIKNVVEIISKFFDVDENLVYFGPKTKEIVKVRHYSFYFLTTLFKLGPSIIGLRMGKDHSDVVFARKKIIFQIKNYLDINKDVQALKKIIVKEMNLKIRTE